MPMSQEQRARAREHLKDVEAESAHLREFQVRLGLAVPSQLSQVVVQYLRSSSKMNQEVFAAALEVHGQTVVGWESGDKTPTFASTINLIVLELVKLATSAPLTNREYNPREGLLGRILACGVLDRAEIKSALERLGEVMITPLDLDDRVLEPVVFPDDNPASAWLTPTPQTPNESADGGV